MRQNAADLLRFCNKIDFQRFKMALRMVFLEYRITLVDSPLKILQETIPNQLEIFLNGVSYILQQYSTSNVRVSFVIFCENVHQISCALLELILTFINMYQKSFKIAMTFPSVFLIFGYVVPSVPLGWVFYFTINLLFDSLSDDHD